MAVSQLIRFHFPDSSFMGYFSRREPMPCSRTEAPLAQWEPRLRGESKSGSWPVHTPFCTSAMTPQPTEQWVQMLRRSSVATPAFGANLSACALRIMVAGSMPATAAPPMVRPERRRKVRRPMASPGIPTATLAPPSA